MYVALSGLTLAGSKHREGDELPRNVSAKIFFFFCVNLLTGKSVTELYNKSYSGINHALVKGV